MFLKRSQAFSDSMYNPMSKLYSVTPNLCGLLSYCCSAWGLCVSIYLTHLTEPVVLPPQYCVRGFFVAAVACLFGMYHAAAGFRNWLGPSH